MAFLLVLVTVLARPHQRDRAASADGNADQPARKRSCGSRDRTAAVEARQ
jgi:hypothetical protein